jgi:hypothetical protein
MIPFPGNPAFHVQHPIRSKPLALYSLRRALCQKISVLRRRLLPSRTSIGENLLEVSGKAVK